MIRSFTHWISTKSELLHTSHLSIINNYGFSIGLNYQVQKQWIFGANATFGSVPSYSSLDAQLTYRVPMLKSQIKVGASNLLNKYYVSFLGRPSVGGMYYVTLAFKNST
ncbi:hypothetical protein GCM10010967_21060 [Dyadobacter beijingensis]|uniref:TonB-dependent receptor-like beta-barrel domain-containing protein n=1 Tax=Dyadobacter beijingensis TaxID=365489 RepID=A0ABQ2HPX5_9BACT|nr:hypothetical protein GCM10010967_21060 [Dyadobacter beijingensis]